MNKPKVYIDGQAGTTGLQIADRLKNREDIELIKIAEDKRHDVSERKKLMNLADVVFLCLPDEAAKEAVKLVENDHTIIIDASTAHRTSWTYGFPELSNKHYEDIRLSKRIANPGCHASGFIALVYPLVASGILDPETFISGHSLTGYSGGGKKMIAQYENEKTEDLFAPRLYGTNLNHKHIPEMMKVCSLHTKPGFVPIVDDYYKGMLVSIVLNNKDLKTAENAQQIFELYRDWYKNQPMIRVADFAPYGMISANGMAGKDSMEIIVSGDDQQTLISARFDNLGKGASGAAVENMNIVLGFEQTKGLNI